MFFGVCWRGRGGGGVDWLGLFWGGGLSGVVDDGGRWFWGVIFGLVRFAAVEKLDGGGGCSMDG